MRRFENNNLEYLNIRKTVEEKVDAMLYESKDLLRYAVLSVTETIRNNPEKYRPLVSWSAPPTISYNNMQYPGSYMYVKEQQHVSIEGYRGMLAEEAGKVYNMIVKDQTDQIIDDYSTHTMTSMSSLTPISSSDE